MSRLKRISDKKLCMRLFDLRATTDLFSTRMIVRIESQSGATAVFPALGIDYELG
jgi:hypothetical protein